jgi:sugar phosphate isomerase/epimerase
LRRRLNDLGLSMIGCHINPLDVAILPRALDYQAELGNSQFGCDIEFYPVGDLDFVSRRCEVFNNVGRLARERGMRFYYHNHFQEFQSIDGKSVYSHIIANTDPRLVYFEIDTYWMVRAGQNPIEWMKRLGERVVLLHQKDFPAQAPQPLNLFDGVFSPTETIDMAAFDQRKNPLCFTEIGTGVLPIQEIIDAGLALPNLSHIVLEQDHTQLDELVSISTSLAAFTSKFQHVHK